MNTWNEYNFRDEIDLCFCRSIFLHHPIYRFAFDIITDIMVYAIALIIFSQSAHNLAEVTAENAMDFTVTKN